MTRYRTARLHELTPAGADNAPVIPVCKDVACLICNISRSAGESRADYVARLKGLYLSGALGTDSRDWWRA
jgi:hypothetical protein